MSGDAINPYKLYLKPWLPRMPDVGNPRKADCIIVQAFGRNDFPNKELYRAREIFTKSGKNDLEAVKALWNRGFNPGRPNIELAEQCQFLIREYGKPALVQWEILPSFDRGWYLEHWKYVIGLWPSSKPGEQFNTRDVCLSAQREMKLNSWKVPMIISHERQSVRAFLVARKIFGVEPVVVNDFTVDSLDGDSVQWKTTSRLMFTPWELLARVHHRMHKWC